MNNLALAVQFFLQLAVILVFCRMVGLIAARFGQPQVVAEMIAGVLLGPSLFGLLLPEAQAWLFPWDKTQKLRDTQSYLFPASQLGLALYMFIVGMELRMVMIKQPLKSLVAASLAGMAAPTGIPNREALCVGALTRARGLMELTGMNIGLKKRILSSGLCVTIVIMAVIPTPMAPLCLKWSFAIGHGKVGSPGTELEFAL